MCNSIESVTDLLKKLSYEDLTQNIHKNRIDIMSKYTFTHIYELEHVKELNIFLTLSVYYRNICTYKDKIYMYIIEIKYI